MEEHGDISVLPEGCISKILSLTSPRDACTSSAISSTFKSASDSDAVWEEFLPDDYRDIAATAVPVLDLRGFASKKELYLSLCDEPLLIDGGNKSFNLEKVSGKKCFMVGARELYIVWSDTPQYWTWTSDVQSRFAEVARLLDVCWLFIQGKIDTRTLSPKTTYVVYLVFKFAENTHGFDQPAEATVNFAEGGGTASGTRSVNLDPEMQVPVHRPRFMQRIFGHVRRQCPRERGDMWMEVEMGEFYNDDGENGQVAVSLAETKSGRWKSGLIVQGIEVRPMKIVADYRDIAARAVPPLDQRASGSKNELDLSFCDEQLLVDDGNESFYMEKVNGKRCFMVGARELYIVWGDTPEYWTWTSVEQSRFAEVAQLLRVCWLLIKGKIDTRVLSPKTTYIVYLVVKFAENMYGFDQPAEVTVNFAGGGGTASGTRSVNLDPRKKVPVHGFRFMQRIFGPARRQFLRERGDGWMEVEMGEFYNDDGENGEVVVSLDETNSGQWKSGLIVQGIGARPKKIVAEKA